MTNKSSFSWSLYQQAPIVGIIRGMAKETILKIAGAYFEAGLYTLEVTMNTEGATNIIEVLRDDFPGLNIGAGTVCNVVDFDKAIEAGAQFIVTPVCVEEVIKKSVAQNIPIFPGAYTPTEIYKAWSLGASAVKVFPAAQLGVKYIKDVSAPLNEIKLLPTGGVNLDNIHSFFKAGAAGVGMGSSLFNQQLIEAEDYQGLEEYFLKFKKEIQEFI